jgi:hypothetical protein
MRSTKRAAVVSALGVFAVCLLFLAPWHRAPLPAAVRSPAPPPRGAAEVALRRAAQYRTRAKLAVSEQRGELEAWDPQAGAEMDADSWRLQQLAFDRDGNLRQARRWAQQAALRARTREEAYRAAELLVLLNHEAGDHEAEFRQAQSLVALAPGSERARLALRRAEACYRRRGRRVGARSPGSSSLP